MKDLKRATRVVVLSVDNISDDYYRALKETHNPNINIDLEPKRLTNPRDLTEHAENLAHRPDTAIYVSTSTCDGICMLTLANLQDGNFNFGIFQHSPDNGALLRVLHQQNRGLAEVWNPAQGVTKRTVA